MYDEGKTLRSLVLEVPFATSLFFESEPSQFTNITAFATGIATAVVACRDGQPDMERLTQLIIDGISGVAQSKGDDTKMVDVLNVNAEALLKVARDIE